MKYFKSPFFICLFGVSPALMAATELPNFELGIGGGFIEEEPMFDLDLTINMPFSQHYTGQLNLNSEYVFDDPTYEDYALSEFNAIGFYRMSAGRVGAGLGILEKKARDDEFDTKRSGVAHLLASYYFDDVTLDAQWSEYEEDIERAETGRLGVLWYPESEQRIGVYHERFADRNGWRIEAFVQPEKYDQKLAFGAIVRDEEHASIPYLGLQVNYYFDRTYTLKQRDRAYH